VIRVHLSDLLEERADAVIRSIGMDMEACTILDRRLGDRAGEEVVERLRASGETPVGGALVTPGGELPAPELIHIVLRSRDEPISESTVSRAFQNALRQAAEWEVGTLALAPLGIGGGNLDAEVSARVVCSALSEHRSRSPFPREVSIVVANAYEEEAFSREVARIFPGAVEGEIEDPTE
jgi:O-acetyl-ADP-ribose deacetylase (regulator of RNase III)